SVLNPNFSALRRASAVRGAAWMTPACSPLTIPRLSPSWRIAEARDADGLSLEVFRPGDARMDDEIVQERVDRARDEDEGGPGERRVERGGRRGLGDGRLAGHGGVDHGRRPADEDELGLETVGLE